MKHATNARGAWSTEVVGPAIGGGVPLAIGVAPSGQVHLAFYAGNGLGYVTNGVDASNLGAFLVTNATWWSVPVVVCVYSLYRVLRRAPPQPGRRA